MNVRYLFALQQINTGLPTEAGRAKETFLRLQLGG